jgi:hypothetical protein
LKTLSRSSLYNSAAQGTIKTLHAQLCVLTPHFYRELP